MRQIVARWMAEHEAKDGRGETSATKPNFTIPKETVPEDIAPPEAIVPEDAAQKEPAPEPEDVKPSGIDAVRRLFEHESSCRPTQSWDPPEDGDDRWDRSSGSGSGAERSDRYRRRRG
jgi:hypothetical protein